MTPYLSPLHTETAKAYAAFCLYRDLGIGRSIDEAYKLYRGYDGVTRKAPGNFQKWSDTHQWVERAKLYDAYLDNKRRQAIEKEHLKELDEYRSQLANSSKAALSAGQMMLKIALTELKKMQDSGEKIHQKTLTAFVNTANNTITSAMDGWGMALSVDELMEILGDGDDT